MLNTSDCTDHVSYLLLMKPSSLIGMATLSVIQVVGAAIYSLPPCAGGHSIWCVGGDLDVAVGHSHGRNPAKGEWRNGHCCSAVIASLTASGYIGGTNKVTPGVIHNVRGHSHLVSQPWLMAPCRGLVVNGNLVAGAEPHGGVVVLVRLSRSLQVTAYDQRSAVAPAAASLAKSPASISVSL
jgi:hypothetical protein